MARRTAIMVKKAYYQMGLVTFLASLLWVSVSIYLALTSPSEVEVEPSLLTPITASIDETTLASIAGRTQSGVLAIELAESLSVTPSGEERVITPDETVFAEPAGTESGTASEAAAPEL